MRKPAAIPQPSRRSGDGEHLEDQGGSFSAVAQQEKGPGQFPDSRQLHLFELPHLLK